MPVTEDTPNLILKDNQRHTWQMKNSENRGLNFSFKPAWIQGQEH